MKLQHGIYVWLMLVGFGCKSAETQSETLVVLDAEVAVARAARSLHIRVSAEPNGPQRFDRIVDATWPFRVAVAPEQGDASRLFRLEADAVASDGRTLGRVRLVSGFVPRQRRYARLLFEADCQSRVDRCADSKLTCRDGDCAPAWLSPNDLLAQSPSRASAGGVTQVPAEPKPSDAGAPSENAGGTAGELAHGPPKDVDASAGQHSDDTSSASPTAMSQQGGMAGMPLAGAPVTGMGAPATGMDGASGAGAQADPGRCTPPNVMVRRNMPIVWLMVDGSGSMEEQATGGISKWELIRRSILDTSPTGGILSQVQSGIQLGLRVFSGPDPAMIDAFSGAPAGGCLHTLRVTPASNNLAAIGAVFPLTPPGESSPTHLAFEELLAEVPADRPVDGPELYVVLITDGSANDFCAVSPGDLSWPEAQARVVKAIGALAQRGVTTYVVSLAPADSPALPDLEAFAKAGSQHKSLQSTSSWADLSLLWADLLGEIGCSPRMNVRVSPDSECLGTVVLDFGALPCSATAGFSLRDESTLMLHGPACQQYRRSPLAMLQATWPCSAYLGPASP